MHQVALSWQVFELTGSVALLGVLGLVRAISLMSTALIGGMFADTRDRRKLLIVTQLILALLSLLVAIMTATGTITVLVLYLVAAAVSITSAFDSPAQQALIPSLVPRDRIPSAMSLNILTGNIAEVAGPAAGGFAVAWIGIAGTYAIDAATFLAVVVAVLLMKARPSLPPIQIDSIGTIKEGLRFIRLTPVIYGIMLLDFLATIAGSSVGLAPVFAQQVFDTGPQGLGLLLSAPAIGAILGAGVMSIIPPPGRPGWVILSAIGVYGLFLASFGLAGSFVVALLLLAGAGAADAVSMSMRHTIRNLATPDELRGRTAAAHSAFSSGGPRLGEFQSGITASFIGPQSAMILGGVGCMIIAAGITWKIPAIRGYRFGSGAASSQPPE